MNPLGQAVLVTFDKTKVTRGLLSRRNVTGWVCCYIDSCLRRNDKMKAGMTVNDSG